MNDAHPQAAAAGTPDQGTLPDAAAPPAGEPVRDLLPVASEDPAHDPYEAAGPAPLGVVRVLTGRPAVDALLDRLGDADHLTADGHLDVYEDVHRGLRAELTALDAPQGPRPYDNRS
ncbi:hypothetical protein [Streptomyces sp. NPDC090025]|uniref:hypothetical protein n=1 Tax=Streptomyces sp. NPDC090025 TaxID=3365922 RepID=UPI0038325242